MREKRGIEYFDIKGSIELRIQLSAQLGDVLDPGDLIRRMCT